MLVTWDTIITAAAVIGAAVTIIKYYNKAHEWVERQNKQDAELRSVKEEQTLLTYGVLACLKGLQEKGCNGPVTDAINKIEKYLNQKAHE